MQMNQVRILAGPETVSLSHTQHCLTAPESNTLQECFHCDSFQTPCVCVLEDDRVRDLTLKGVAAHCSQSALWDTSARERVTHSRLSEQVNTPEALQTDKQIV